MPLDCGLQLGRYTVVEPLGAGGMGEVYRARDTRLNRDVAIKVLPAGTAETSKAVQRFQREAQAVAALSHPNILAIFDVGEADGVAYAVMELLEGETLRERIRSGALPWRTVVDTAMGLAQGLAAAHGRDIVHRDLKPENIFITSDGMVKVLDFGLARTAPLPGSENSNSPTAIAATQPGVMLGTFAYMSPEQVRGEAADARSDLFALGCVIYEMLTARRAFPSTAPAEIITSILRDHPPEPGSFGTRIPVQLERLVMHCLEKSPGERFQSARDLAFALRTLASAGSDIEMSAGMSSAGSGRSQQVSPDCKAIVSSVAVLPFTAVAGTAEEMSFSDQLGRMLVGDLSALNGLRVASRRAAAAFRDDPRPTGEIATALNVESLLEGSIHVSQQTVRVTLELVDAQRDSTVWASRFDGSLSDPMTLQADISRQCADGLRSCLRADGDTQDVESAAAKRSVSPAAREAYLKGRFYWNRRTETDLRRSLDLFNQALEIEPTYAQAWAGLADVYNILGFYFYMAPKECFPRAKAAALKALELDPDLTDVHALVGYVRLYHDWDWDGAERDMRRSMESHPDSSEGHRYLANFLTARGRLDEALECFLAARQHDPLSLINCTAVGWAQYYRREYDQALASLWQCKDMDRNFALGRLYSGWVLATQGRLEDALPELKKANEIAGRVPFTQAFVANGLALAGQTDEAQAILSTLESEAPSTYVSPYLLAIVHLGLGDHDKAFECLFRAVEERVHWLVFMDVEPRLDAIREDPRFAELRQKVGVVGS